VSNLERDPVESECGGGVDVAAEPVRDLLTGHQVALGGPRGLEVTRTLPTRGRRMVGAWCFVDHYGPVELGGAAGGAGNGSAGMRVPPHPHTGLQTVSWLVEGEVLHRDSLGSTQLVTPGQLNLMTAGRGISHSEETPAEHSPRLHGVQLWVALPGGAVSTAPAFAHHADLPVDTRDGVTTTVIMGELGGATSSATVFTPLVGAELRLTPGTATRLPLVPDYEHAVLAMSGAADVDGVPLAPGPLLYLGTGRRELAVAAEAGARLLLIGGVPFEERIVMWWNLVGRTHDDIVRAREEWQAGGPRFGTVTGYDGDPLPAPAMPATRLKPRGRVR
jgi:redox-sensitive bicupin YhaK (pirin superfamily)